MRVHTFTMHSFIPSMIFAPGFVSLTMHVFFKLFVCVYACVRQPTNQPVRDTHAHALTLSVYTGMCECCAYACVCVNAWLHLFPVIWCIHVSATLSAHARSRACSAPLAFSPARTLALSAHSTSTMSMQARLPQHTLKTARARARAHTRTLMYGCMHRRRHVCMYACARTMHVCESMQHAYAAEVSNVGSCAHGIVFTHRTEYTMTSGKVLQHENTTSVCESAPDVSVRGVAPEQSEPMRIYRCLHDLRLSCVNSAPRKGRQKPASPRWSERKYFVLNFDQKLWFRSWKSQI